MDCSTSSFPVHNQLPELTQIRVPWVGDAIQQSAIQNLGEISIKCEVKIPALRKRETDGEEEDG